MKHLVQRQDSRNCPPGRVRAVAYRARCLARRDDANAGVVVAQYRGGNGAWGTTYARYLIWHPVDHIHFRVLQRLPDGCGGPAALFHLVEDVAAQGRRLIGAAVGLVSLDETGAAVELHVLGNTALRIEGQFLPRTEGVQLISTMTIGFSGWLHRTGLNPWLIEWRFPARLVRAL